ncbi:hypothetical protein Micbo1qcDRAFT_152945 [Microdochium bolleyi]|uniref:Uncharacterized protein n=1 Tax=Microdochium bolleyi TaxID=196109 RepID=A0A136IN48_9PEZI|nr:hypothetical protein Micbo1qcDRAFT_152945 [Microdochium bolleyi]
MAEPKRLTAEDYTVGWICTIRPELVAAKVFLDETHESLDEVSRHDTNSYTLGRVGRHNVVVLILGSMGTASAAAAMRNMAHTFPEIRFALMVGIGGGAPTKQNDIRLGDVVVNLPGDKHGGVVQWDFGKELQEHGFQRTGFLNQSPEALRTAIRDLQTDHDIHGHGLEDAVDQVLQRSKKLRDLYQRPDPEMDRLFERAFVHPGEEATCFKCASEPSRLSQRPERDEDEQTVVHYGLIASGNAVVENALLRDNLAAELGVLCFEMAAAGLMNHFPSLAIRGICDYSDSHKNKQWQGYAAMIAAAYAKQVLVKVVPSAIKKERRVLEVLDGVVKSTSEIVVMTQDINARQRVDADQKTLNWITAIDYGAKHSDHLEMLHPDTGQWLLQTDEFEDWINGRVRTMFCHGILGSGKTLMTSMVTEHCRALAREQGDTAVVWIYCNFRETDDQRAADLLASVLKQTAQAFPTIPECVQRLYEAHQAGWTRPSIRELLQTISTVMAQLSKVYILVDALDQCQTTDSCRDQFLDELRRLQTNHAVQLFLTSREVPEIRSKVYGWNSVVSVEVRASEHDVRSYVDGQLDNFPIFVRNNPDLRSRILDKISETVEGMFLLAKLYLDILRPKVNVKKLVTALADLQRGEEAYKSVYDETMGRIKSQHVDHVQLAIETLSWITRANQPLTPGELQTALSVEDGITTLDESNKTSLDTILSVCAGLVVIDTGSRVVRLAHNTAQEYFRTTWRNWFPDAETQITRTLLTYLCHDRPKKLALVGIKCPEWNFKDDTLYMYAVGNLGRHARQSNDVMALYLTAYFGLPGSTQLLLEEGGRADPMENERETPL